MKILHINCNYTDTLLHRKMIEHLNEFGVESCVYVPVYKKTDDVATSGAKVIVSECFRRWHRIFFDYKQSRIISDVDKKLDCSEYDCIHAYTLFTDGNCARRLSRKYNIPYVTAVRSTDVNVFLKKAFYLRGRAVKILRDASAVFFLSECYREQVLENYVPERFRREIYAKSYIIPNGIDDFWLENRIGGKPGRMSDLSQEKKLRVICAGVISRRKNHMATQEALQILRAQGWSVHYQIVGRIQDRQLFEKVMSYPDTEYIPQQPKEKLLEYYRQNDLFVLPSHTETFGLVYAEALSQGIPVLYTRGQGFDGQFGEGTVGYAMDAEDPADIAQKILLATEHYEELAENTQQCVHKFNWLNICEEYRDIYDKITEK